MTDDNTALVAQARRKYDFYEKFSPDTEHETMVILRSAADTIEALEAALESESGRANDEHLAHMRADRRAKKAERELDRVKQTRAYVRIESVIRRAENAEREEARLREAHQEQFARAEKAEQERDACAAVLLKVRLARSSHPACDVHDDDDPVQCGWKSAVQDIDQVLASATNIEKGTPTP